MSYRYGDLPEKVSLADIVAKIRSTEYQVIEPTTTLCIITMKNDFKVIGHSACVSKEVFNTASGEAYAWNDAIRQLGKLEAYLLSEQRAQYFLDSVLGTDYKEAVHDNEYL
tara:strand:- start:3926 stop:4258 length:333 start_codon:yes stop_codon:yes gene_type:complete